MTISQLKRLKVATETLTQWASTGNAFGHYQVISDGVTITKGPDKIYEFWCLLRILDDLRVNYNIECVPSKRVDGKIFPQAPSPKNGWAYFKIINKTNKDNKFQICYGTEIKLSKALNTTIAPDISIQQYKATEDPDENMVELIMDAKFKYKNTASLPIEQIHAFMQRVNALQTQNAVYLPLMFNSLKNIKSNCLLTNGKGLADHEEYCKLNHIKQVEMFDVNNTMHVIG